MILDRRIMKKDSATLSSYLQCDTHQYLSLGSGSGQSQPGSATLNSRLRAWILERVKREEKKVGGLRRTVNQSLGGEITLAPSLCTQLFIINYMLRARILERVEWEIRRTGPRLTFNNSLTTPLHPICTPLLITNLGYGLASLSGWRGRRRGWGQRWTFTHSLNDSGEMPKSLIRICMQYF